MITERSLQPWNIKRRKWRLNDSVAPGRFFVAQGSHTSCTIARDACVESVHKINLLRREAREYLRIFTAIFAHSDIYVLRFPLPSRLPVYFNDSYEWRFFYAVHICPLWWNRCISLGTTRVISRSESFLAIPYNRITCPANTSLSLSAASSLALPTSYECFVSKRYVKKKYFIHFYIYEVYSTIRG